jgi:hypothetical protein
LKHRTPEQTILDHVASIEAGRLDEAMCDFAPNAAIILPGQVVTGLDAIRGGLEGIGALLGGAPPEIRTITAHGSTVLLTFSAFGTPCTIPDGSDTYIGPDPSAWGTDVPPEAVLIRGADAAGGGGALVHVLGR